jgi:Lambda phage tail tape-measure protein (Tape_meas_lam_C)
MEYRNQVEQLDLQIAAAGKNKGRARRYAGDRDLAARSGNKRLQALVQETLQLQTARDGVKAFFIEMQQDARSAAGTVYEALNSALDRTSANLAKLFSGQKTNWAQSFKDIGDQMLQSSIKSGLQKGLGALAHKFMPGLIPAAKNDGSGPDLAPALAGIPGGNLGGMSGGVMSSGISSFFGKLLGEDIISTDGKVIGSSHYEYFS